MKEGESKESKRVSPIIRKEQITVSEAGQRGGNATLENQGRDFFKNIGKKGGEQTARLYSHLMREHGKRGGRPRRSTLDWRKGEKRRK